MSNTSPKNPDALLASHQPTPASRAARTGVEVWRVTRDGRILSCVLHDDSRAGAAWEVVLWEGEEWLLGRRCPDEAFAHFVANGLKQDHVNKGWTEQAIEKGGA